jgi:NitT/TauT family transport system permease protein
LRNPRYRWGIASVFLLAALAAAQLASSVIVFPPGIPAPSDVVLGLTQNPDLFVRNAAPTLAAACTGFLAAIGLAAVIAILVFTLPVLRSEVVALALVVNSIPLIALTPLLVVFLGSGHVTRSVIAAISSFFPILVGLLQGLRRVDASCQEMLTLYAATRWEQFRSLALPTALPFLFSGMKIGAPNAVLAAVIAEWAGSSNGLGLLMVQSLFSFNVAQTWGAIVSCCVLALGAFGLVALLEHWALRSYGTQPAPNPVDGRRS